MMLNQDCDAHKDHDDMVARVPYQDWDADSMHIDATLVILMQLMPAPHVRTMLQY